MVYGRNIKLRRTQNIQIRRLAFIEMKAGPVGAIALSSLLIEKTGIPGVILRVRRRIPINAYEEKVPFKRGDGIVIVHDVVTTGWSLMRAIEMLEGRGGIVVGAIAAIHRGDPSVEAQLAARGIRLAYASRIKDREDLVKGILRGFLRPAVMDLKKAGRSERVERAGQAVH